MIGRASHRGAGPTEARLAGALLAHEVGRLIELLWQDNPPWTANALHSHVFRVWSALASVPEIVPGRYL